MALLGLLPLLLPACWAGESGNSCTDAGGRTPAAGAPAAVVSCGPGERVSVALVFDAAADVRETLEVLREGGARASFVVTGLWAEQHPDLLNAIAAEGHQLLNGSYNGLSFTGASTGLRALTPEERARELSRTETTVFRMSSRSTRPFFAPPYGDYDDSVLEDAGAAGYAFVVAGARLEGDEPMSGVLSAAAPGVILHVNERPDIAGVIEALREEGYVFETVADIIE